MKVLKYPLVSDVLQMPRGAKLLHVDFQDHLQQASVWALVNPDAPLVSRPILRVLTGQEFNSEGLVHIGTSLMDGGAFVVHYFDGGEVLP